MRHMRVVVAHYGGPEVIRVIGEDVPIPEAGDIRVEVMAGGVRLEDVLARWGVHPDTPRVGNQVLEILEGRDRRSRSVIEQGGVFTGNAQIDRMFGLFEGNPAAPPTERQSLVGRGEGAGDAAVD